MICNGITTEYEGTVTKEIVPIYKKYNLTIAEAAKYFGIGEKTLRRIVSDNPSADYIIMVGAKVLLKRKLFEKFIDETNSI